MSKLFDKKGFQSHMKMQIKYGKFLMKSGIWGGGGPPTFGQNKKIPKNWENGCKIEIKRAKLRRTRRKIRKRPLNLADKLNFLTKAWQKSVFRVEKWVLVSSGTDSYRINRFLGLG